VNASIEFYERICKQKLPTPTKFHYTFNLRDLSKVFQGISRTDPDSVATAGSLTRLWIYELSRVFYDRLNCQEDKKWFREQLLDIRRSHLKVIKEKEFNLDCLFSDIFNIEEEFPSYEEVLDQ